MEPTVGLTASFTMVPSPFASSRVASLKASPIEDEELRCALEPPLIEPEGLRLNTFAPCSSCKGPQRTNSRVTAPVPNLSEIGLSRASFVFHARASGLGITL